MKKSRSITRPEFESLPSTTLRRQVEQPGKLPLLVLPTSSATPKKQSAIKATVDTTPNYIKSTTSSEARKGRAQVSSRSAENSSASGLKQSRTLARTSSLKLARTLTKTPSFKPTRASARKCSPVRLCENPDVQRATCSSTSKDHKFPAHLTLSNGGTESGGTSIVKVCSYTYCSLNGHHHDPLPPLKCFLSARRRMLKTQRSKKPGCQYPCRTKPHRDIMKEIEAEQMNHDEKPPIQGGSISLTIAPLTQKEHAGFFIEIYSKESEGIYQNNPDTTDSSVADIKPPIGVSDATRRENEQEVHSNSDEPVTFGVDSLQNVDQSRDVTFLRMDADGYLPEQNQKTKVAEEIYPPCSVQGGTETERLNLMYKVEIESASSIQSEEGDSETSDMDGEVGMHTAPSINEGPFSPSQINCMTDLKEAYLALENTTLDEFIKSDKTAGGNSEEDSPNEIMRASLDAETVSEAWSSDEESQFTGPYEDSGSNIFMTSDNPSHTSLAPEELTDMEKEDYNDRSDEYVDTMATLNSAPLEKAAKKPSLTIEDKEEGSEPEKETLSIGPEVGNGIECIIKTREGNLADCQKYEFLQDDAAQHVRNQEFQYPRGMLENWNKVMNSIGTQTCNEFEDPHQMSGNLDEVLKKSIGAQTDFEDHQSDALLETCCFTDEILDGIRIPMSKDPQAENCFETEQGEPDKTLGEAFTDQAQDCSSFNQSASSSDNLDSTEKDGNDAIETAEKNNLEDQTHSRITGTSSPGNADQEIHTIQAGDAIDASSSRIKDGLRDSDSYEELATTCRTIKGANRAVEEKKTKEFNPRAPNFLSVEPDPEAEKVDLKHLVLDEKKNTKEWMLDQALQQAITKLAPARKRKVELLVEAFETVLPIPNMKLT